MELLKTCARKIADLTGYSIQKIDPNFAVEFSTDEADLVRYILKNRLSMTSIPRLVNTLQACKYVVENNIPGDFVECGVWRGGNGILAKKIFENLGSDKKVWMFDTFEGMTEPTDIDVSAGSQVKADKRYRNSLAESHSNWCYASLEDVKRNCEISSVDVNSINFIQGDVSETLNVSTNIPNAISVLRLDTDWYESTKTELEVLYPVLCSKGVLIIDDYGHWEGARKAVDEYFHDDAYKPFLHFSDYTGRSAIKL